MKPGGVVMAEVRRFVRSGGYAWPGGYQCALTMSDGESLCCKCASSEYRSIARDTRFGYRDGWRAEGVSVLWEGPDEVCCHCGEAIPTVFGDIDSALNGGAL